VDVIIWPGVLPDATSDGQGLNVGTQMWAGRVAWVRAHHLNY